MSPGEANVHAGELIDRRWLSQRSFEVELTRPPAFTFTPGQHIRLMHQDLARDYSLTSAPLDTSLAFCVRHVPEGQFSPFLIDDLFSESLVYTEIFY